MTINRKSAVTESTQRVCVGSIAAHIDKFAEFLVGEGYASQTVKAKYALVVALSHWIKRAWSVAGKARRSEAQTVLCPPS
jgi:hypothetical protein